MWGFDVLWVNLIKRFGEFSFCHAQFVCVCVCMCVCGAEVFFFFFFFFFFFPLDLLQLL
jgi:hypothetical protein